MMFLDKVHTLDISRFDCLEHHCAIEEKKTCLEIKNLSFQVENGDDKQKEILDNINLSIFFWRFVAITGQMARQINLAKMIMGIEKPTGQIFFNGEDITEKYSPTS